MVTVTKPRVTRLGRFVRGRRFDRNPLRRATDRLETAVLALIVAAFLLGAPFAALAAGTWVHGMARQAQLDQQASRFQVTAVVVTSAASAAGAANDFAWQAQARWRAPDGKVVVHEVPVPANTVAGAKLQVWTDRAGDITGPPLTDSQVAQQAMCGEATAVGLTAGLLTLTGVAALRAIRRRQLADWDADWHATGPRWTTRA